MAAAMASAAYAQDTTDSSGTTELETIFVSGEKVTRSVKVTASSVEVISDEEIEEEAGVTSVTEAINEVPNVVVYGTVSGVPAIRGLDSQGPNTGTYAFMGGTTPRATINVDGHYQSYYEYVFGAASIWDLQSIEVFRGPQTTSQGANAIAGAIVVNTKDPTFTPEAAYQMEYGSYDHRRASAMVSGPLSDELAARLTMDYTGRDTFIDYVNTSFSQGNTDQNFRSLNLRAKLLWQPDELPGFEAKFTYSFNKTNRPSSEAAMSPYTSLESTATSMPSWAQQTNVGILDLSYDFENGVKIFNQTQFSSSDVIRTTEPATLGSAEIYQRTFSNDARVTLGDEDDQISGFAGVYYSHVLSDEYLNFRPTTYGTTQFYDTKDNLGIYGELTYKLTDQWTLTGGLRYERNHIRRTGETGLATNDLNYNETFDAWLPKVSLAYDVTEDIRVGGLVSRGYNPGGLTLNVATSSWQEFEPETLWNYELFGRANFLGGDLVINGNLFFMDIANSQRFVVVDPSLATLPSYTVNAEHAITYGLELSADYQMMENLKLTAGAGILKTKFLEFSEKSSYVGNEFAKSPGYMLSFGASWDVTEKFNISADMRYVDGYFSDDENNTIYEIDPYTIANVKASYAFNDHMEFYGYVKNIFDNRAPIFMQSSRSVRGTTEAYINDPRTFGVGIRGKF